MIRQERDQIPGFTPNEQNYETLFNRIYEYNPPDKEALYAHQGNLTDQRDNLAKQLKRQRYPSVASSELSDKTTPSNSELENIEDQRDQISNQIEETEEFHTTLPNISTLSPVHKNTVAYSSQRGPTGHTILADMEGSLNDAIWRSLQQQMQGVTNQNPDARNLVSFGDVGYAPMTYTSRFQ